MKRARAIISLIALIGCLSVIGTFYVITITRPEKETAVLMVNSSPITGISLTINGTPQTTNYTDALLKGSYSLVMAETYDGYVWSHWLEDSDTNRAKTVTLGTDITLTAVYEIPPSSTLELPRLAVSGNKLIDDHNDIVRLRGVSIADPYYLAHYDYHFSEEIFAELSNWNINVVRIPIHPGWWQSEEEYSPRYLDPIVSWGKKYGFYIILDWHAIGNPLTGETQNPMWKEGRYTVYNSSFQLAESAWTELAKRYGGKSWVIFELFNEPASINGQSVDWSVWRDKLTVLIDKIRTFTPNTLILVSGWQWTYDLRGFATYPVERDGIAYVAHVYPNHKEWEDYFGFLSYAHPVIVTEWGFSPTVSSTEHYYGTRENFGDPFLRYMEDKNISWTAWCFHPTWQPNMITSWNFELTEEGRLVKQALAADELK